MSKRESIEMLQSVARALGPLTEEVVFVGGTIPALLITDPAAPPTRPTKDVDLIVDTRSHQKHAVFEEKLRKRGFQIKAPPVCRYGIGDILVDVMPAHLGGDAIARVRADTALNVIRDIVEVGRD